MMISNNGPKVPLKGNPKEKEYGRRDRNSDITGRNNYNFVE